MQNHIRLLKNNAKLLIVLSLLPISGCTCVDDNEFFGFPDAGPDAGPDAPPPPPVFPLKAGDEVKFPALGGRAEPCAGAEGSCERTMVATYTINDVELNGETNRWEIDATFLYELPVANIEAAAMGQLFLSGAAPFGTIDANGSDSGDATFVADGAPTDGMREDRFPFFHFEAEYSTEGDSAYQVAAGEFTTRILEIDPDANIENQAAEAKIEAYFRDDLGVNTFLHKIRVDYHPFGFICGWEERLVTWDDAMNRVEGDFAGLTIPLAAVWVDPVTLIRDDVRYRCSCFSNTCADTSDSTMCLDPADPDQDPLPCACLNNPDPGPECP